MTTEWRIQVRSGRPHTFFTEDGKYVVHVEDFEYTYFKRDEDTIRRELAEILEHLPDAEPYLYLQHRDVTDWEDA